MANKSNTIKGNSVKIQTFNDWAVSNVIGHKTDTDGNVNFIWCKVCAGNKDSIQTDPRVRGKAKESSIKAFIEGTACVTKYQVRLQMTSIFPGVKIITFH